MVLNELKIKRTVAGLEVGLEEDQKRRKKRRKQTKPFVRSFLSSLTHCIIMDSSFWYDTINLG